MKPNFNRLAKISLALVFLVILAGAVVRMTGSGMGCPDWPKCFGYYIPPTEVSDLEWQPGREYQKGQVIIWNETLLVATGTFTTDTTYRPEHWEPYERHNYAVFNVYHTWTEFINRLMGALAGLATLVLAIVSWRYRKSRPLLTFLAFTVVLAMGFQAWLGATVVYSVLEPVKITVHMLMALAIVALLLYLIHRSEEGKVSPPADPLTAGLLVTALCMTLVQVVLGTQVRQFIDEQADVMGSTNPELWLEGAGWEFYIHRTFSIAILLLNALIMYRVWNKGLGYKKINWVMALLIAEALTGIAMNYADFPPGSQPLHLVLASLIFALQFYLVLEAVHAPRKHISL